MSRASGIKQGYSFELEWSLSLRQLKDSGVDFWWSKMLDASWMDRQKVKCKACGTKIELPWMMWTKSPADFLVIKDHGLVQFHELKSSHQDRYPKANVDPDQIRTGIQISSLGVPYVFIFCDRRDKGAYKAWALEARMVNELWAEEPDVKSVKWETFDRLGWRVPRLKNRQWGVQEVLAWKPSE